MNKFLGEIPGESPFLREAGEALTGQLDRSTAWKGRATKSNCLISSENSMIDEETSEKVGGTGFPACAQNDKLRINRRNLPHWQLTGSTYFVTFPLKSGIITDDERKIVLDAIKYFHKIRYWVIATVVMPDHIHLLLKQVVSESNAEFSLSKILQGIRGLALGKLIKQEAPKAPYGRMKVLIALSEIMMSVWRNGIIYAIIQSQPDYVRFLRNIHFSGSQGKSEKRTAWKGCATK